MISRRELGIYGEKIAIEFLKRHNCQIITTNFRAGKNEIDIIIKTNEEIVFIEVKTRLSVFYGLPEYAVNQQKLKNIINCAYEWIISNNYQGAWRIDIISIEINNYRAKIKWFKNCGENFN